MDLRALFIFSIVLVSACSDSSVKLNNRIKKQLENIAKLDQKYRALDYDNNVERQQKLDKLNLKVVIGIIDSFGWLGHNEIGEIANETLFLVIQHSDKSTMEKYLPVMKDAVYKGNASTQDLALLIDRIEILNGRPQIYGSQVLKIGDTWTYHELVDTIKLNEKRKEMGLDSFENYILNFTSG